MGFILPLPGSLHVDDLVTIDDSIEENVRRLLIHQQMERSHVGEGLYFFCSSIQFNSLLSPYPCFISLLYLDLYVLGDDALIS